MKIAHPTVLAVHLRDDGMGGCENYRVRIPYEQIRERIKGGVADWTSVGMARKWASGQLGMRTRPTDYDIVVWPRHRPLPYGVPDHDGSPTPDLQTVQRELGPAAGQLGITLEGKSGLLDLIDIWKRKAAVVLEYDDDHHTGSRHFGGYEYDELVVELMRRADAITVTTPYLRRICLQAAPDVPVYTLPNCVCFGEWQEWARWTRWPEDYVVLGLTGSTTHGKDWQVMEAVLPRILKDHGNAALLLQGFVPDYLKPLICKYPERVYADDAFRSYEEYPMVVRQADIVLCPVIPDDKFNLAKSNIKAVEGLAAGRPLSIGGVGGATPIMSPLDYYREVAGNGHRGIVIKDHYDADRWYDAISALIQDKERRERYGRAGWKWVKKNRSIEAQWHLWWDAYRAIYRRKQNGNAIAVG